MAAKTYKICCLPGDGIGPEVIAEGKKVLAAVGAKADVEFIFQDHLIGGAAIDACGDPLPDETLAAAKAADAVLLASVGGPKWDSTDPNAPRPEQGLLRIRKGLGLYTNLRPVKIYVPGQRVHAAPGGHPRRRHGARPRAHGRHLLRPPRALL